MRSVLGSLRQMSTSIWVRLPENSERTGNHPDRVPDVKAFTDAFDAAQERLRELLNPEEVIKWVET